MEIIRFKRIVVSIFVVTLYAQETAPDIFCNKKNQTWNEARENCYSVNGELVAYKAGLAENVSGINLNKGTDVWTADYALKVTSGTRNYYELCGFNYLMQDAFQHSMELYGQCYAERNYFCKNLTTGELYVLTDTRHNARCNDKITEAELIYNSHIIEAGYYWTTTIHYVTKDKAEQQKPTTTPFLCGAFSPSIGKYFDKCDTQRMSLCYIRENHDTRFDKSCIVTDVTTKTMIEATSHFPRTDSTEEVDAARNTDDKKNFGVIIGLPLGLVIALVVGIFLSIYIIRSYNKKCHFMKAKGRESVNKNTVIWNNVSSARQNVSLFNRNGETSTAHTQDQTRSTTAVQSAIPVYAAVNKLNTSTKTQRNISLTQEYGYVNLNLTFDEINYSCTNVRNAISSNEFAKPMETSQYSFAKETEEGTVHDHQPVRNDVYDVTGHLQNVQASSNIYNTLQREDFNSPVILKSGAMSQNDSSELSVESVYDSSAQKCVQSSVTDNIYNHFSQADTYNHISTRPTCGMTTDQTYA